MAVDFDFGNNTAYRMVSRSSGYLKEQYWKIFIR